MGYYKGSFKGSTRMIIGVTEFWGVLKGSGVGLELGLYVSYEGYLEGRRT